MRLFRQHTMILVFVTLISPFAGAEPSVVMQALKSELSRSIEVLGEEPAPPYFLSFEVTEQDTASVTGSYGVLIRSNRQRNRFLDVDLRVGGYDLDNTRPTRGPGSGSFRRRSLTPITIEDDIDAIRSAAWIETDNQYKQALEQLIKVKSDVQLKVDTEDQSEDFSHEKPQKLHGKTARLDIKVADWEAKVKRYTAPFAKHGDIYSASATFSATAGTRWFVNSEGTEIQTSETIYQLSISAHTEAEDGMKLPLNETWSSFTTNGLPSDETVLQQVERMIADLAALRDAPVTEPYTGPAILSGRASGVFFHEILGHRIEGHRQKRVDEGQTFKKKIGEQILPADFTVTFDPSRRKLAGSDLAGSYEFDNQGVKARPVNVVKNGVLKNFLMSRTPVEGFPHSNGHGRKATGYKTVSRQSNLIVEVARPLRHTELKERLVAMIQEEGKPYGLLIKDIQGGVTTTGRFSPNAFRVQPVLVYRVHPDGREELVRGVDLIGTPLTTLSHVVAGDDRISVFNGTCGAESGGVPVSAVSPGILVSQVEVQKKPETQDRRPILPPPANNADAAKVMSANSHGDDVLINAMRDELARSMQSLKIEQMGNPYFLAYRVDEIKGFQVSASFGAIKNRSETNSRTLSVELRIGNHNFDNTNFLGRSNSASFRSIIPLPLENDYSEIRRQLWLATDKAYKRAQDLLARKQAALNNQSREEVPDFYTAEPITTQGKTIVSKLTLDTAESLVRELSQQFKDMPEINDSRVEAGMNNRRSVYINSEKTTFTYSLPVAWIQTLARTQSSDGTVLQDFDVIYQRSGELPDLKSLQRRVSTMGDALSTRREAEFVDRYSGPVLFEGQAAAELFVQVMAPRLLAIRVPFTENPRMNRVTEAVRNPFVDKIGSRVLPRFLSVRDDPTLPTGNGGGLLGGYPVDDDGIPVKPAVLIENGILKTLLATRNPVAGVTAQTGNRRGILPLPGNLLITGEGGLTKSELHDEFMQLIAERGIGYGIIVRRIGNWLHKINYPMDTFRQSGGGGQTSVEHLLQAYKVFPDGREVPIRIAELSGITASTFKDIVAISHESTNHSMMYSQASSSILLYSSALYGIPRTDVMISIATPDLLFEDITVRKPPGNIPNPPVAAHPLFDSK